MAEPRPSHVSKDSLPRVTIKFFVGDSSSKHGGFSYTEDTLAKALQECRNAPVFIGILSGDDGRRYVSATGVPAEGKEGFQSNTVERAVGVLLEKEYITPQLAEKLMSRIAEVAQTKAPESKQEVVLPETRKEEWRVGDGSLAEQDAKLKPTKQKE